MNRLQAILDHKRTEIARLIPRMEHLRAAALLRDDYRGFASALDRGPEALGLVAEVKKASPSVGVIAENFDPVAIAKAYETAGAHAISVLTDEQFFQGHLRYLAQIRKEVGLPLLRKDFILHEAQIYEAAVAGADAILLIVAALEQPELERLHETATTLGLDALVEVHSLPELDRALDCGARVIGINNRNLTTFEVDLRATEIISEEVPEGVLLLSESGIKTNADARRVFACGVNALLVGESLMRTGDVAAQVAALLDVA
ncbi:MAG: indole-3-glycerol phosphate synthase TrpC [Chthoniobacteraceae bacterium]|nr:indole-3-glycerol phosphate synthase TrpC [Chthoniobacteraceae bacterium]